MDGGNNLLFLIASRSHVWAISVRRHKVTYDFHSYLKKNILNSGHSELLEGRTHQVFTRLKVKKWL